MRKLLIDGSDDREATTYTSILSMNAIKERIVKMEPDCLEYPKLKEYPSNSPQLVDVIFPLCAPFPKEDYIIFSFVKYREPDRAVSFMLIRSGPIDVRSVEPPR